MLDPTYAKAYLRRGELKQRCGDFGSACDDYTSASRFDSGGAVGLEAARKLSEAQRERDAQKTYTRQQSSRHHHSNSNHQNSRAGDSGHGGGAAVPKPKQQKCHYEVLGIDPAASADDVRKAYKKARPLLPRDHPV